MITDIAALDTAKRYTYADYLQWAFEEQLELIKGKIFKMSPAPNRKHQQISGEFFKQIANYLHKKPCKVFDAPFDVRLLLSGDGDAPAHGRDAQALHDRLVIHACVGDGLHGPSGPSAFQWELQQAWNGRGINWFRDNRFL